MARKNRRRRSPGLATRASQALGRALEPLKQKLQDRAQRRAEKRKAKVRERLEARAAANTDDSASRGKSSASASASASARRHRRDALKKPKPLPDELPPRGPDLLLLAVTFALVGLGVAMVYSSSAIFAASRYKDSMFFLRRDVVYAGVGMVALLVGSRIDYRLYRRFAYPMLLGVIVLLALLAVPGLGTRIDGAVRWFRIGGVSFQPSELAKIALLVYLAYSLAKKRTEMRIFSIGFLPHLIVAGFVSALVLRQPDLGSAAILMSVTMMLLLVAGTKLSYVLLAAIAAAPLAYQQIVGTPWRLRRLLAFLDPWAHRRDAGYQMAESLISVGSGGLQGLGLGDGRQKLFFLPAAHTDFIFAIIGEELGFIGIIAVLGLYGLFVWRGLRAAHGARDLFGGYLAYGITALFGLQALLHMSVVLGLVPTKGITLPLVSYGGTALVVSCYCVGILINIGMRKLEPLPRPAKVKAAAKKNKRPMVRRVLAPSEPDAAAAAAATTADAAAS